MRGRLAGIEMLSYSVGPLGGQVRAGVVADLWTVRGSVASGGALCLAGVAATALWLRDFRLLFLAGTVFYLGGMVSYVALPYQLYRITGSNLAAGSPASRCCPTRWAR